MREIRLLAPTGNLGSGYSVDSLKLAMAESPDIIACDSGSTDGGPSYLGSGKPYFPAPMYRRDLRPLVLAAHNQKVPLVIGSAAGSGTDKGVDMLAEIVGEIAVAEGLQLNVARIYSEQPRSYLSGKLAAGKTAPLWPSSGLQSETIDSAERIVGMMGCEPLVDALEAGADVIIAGRATDASLFAALPISWGFAPGPAWHAGKILECGAAATVHRLVPDCMMAVVNDDSFIVSPLDPRMRCSSLSVAAHTLYENSDPYEIREPSGTLVTRDCKYEQLDNRSVRVTGSAFNEAEAYSVKLEASEMVGCQAVAIAGIRDPYVLLNLDEFVSQVQKRAAGKLKEVLALSDDSYKLKLHIYGRDAVMGPNEPIGGVSHEVAIVFDAVAPEQEQADTIVSMASYVALHNPVEKWTGMVTNLANAYSPPLMSRGPAFRFSMNHVVFPDTPQEMFRTELGRA